MMQSTFDSVPTPIKRLVLEFLDAKSILRFQQTSKSAKEICDNRFWSQLVIRDYVECIGSSPASDDETSLQNIDYDNLVKEESEDEPANDEISFHFHKINKKMFKVESEGITNANHWKEKYLEYANLPNYSGHWIGDYGSHGTEILKVTQKGYTLRALKLTGDPNVPQGKETFRMTFEKTCQRAIGKIHLADTGFLHPRWSTAVMRVVNPNVLEPRWFIQDYDDEWVELPFRIIRLSRFLEQYGAEVLHTIEPDFIKLIETQVIEMLNTQ